MRPYIQITVVFSILICLYTNLHAQVAINEDSSDPDASAMLDISSSDKGLLIPRMDSTSRNDISNPATGLMVFDTDNNSFWYYDGSVWSEVGRAGFISENGFTHSTDNNDDFVFGADSLNYGAGSEYKFFFDKSKGAFRAGMVTDTFWNESYLGDFSAAFGESNMASGRSSFASGDENIVSGRYSASFGQYNEVSEDYSFAAGDDNTISDGYSAAFGEEHIISSEYSFAAGEDHIISNDYAAAFGYGNEISGYMSFAGGGYHSISGEYSAAFGEDNVVSGDYSFSTGDYNTVNGDYANALGRRLSANSYGEVAIGFYSTTYTVNSATAFDSADRLFVIGNGTSTSDLSDALVIYKNGNTEINGDLTVNGSLAGNNSAFTSENSITYSNNNDDDFVFGADSLNYGTGSEYKFFFDKSKGAFRAGMVTDTFWNESYLGDYSAAFGESNIVSGKSSFAGGYENIVSSRYAAAFGYQNEVSNYYSFAAGSRNIVSDDCSAAFGEDNQISSEYSFAAGEDHIISNGYAAAFGYDNEISSEYSFAAGEDHIISNDYAAAFGYDNEISGYMSFAGGGYHSISGEYSAAFGEDNIVSGDYSFTAGDHNTVNGDYANALGRRLSANSYGEVAIGFYNTTYTVNSATAFDSADRLFIIGNGTSTSDLSDALVIYKNGNTEINGNVGIGTTATNGKLEINGSLDNIINGYTYVSNVNSTTAYVSSNTDPKEVSIYASDRIVGKFVISLSDERIKDIHGISDSEKDLDILNQIEITDYEFIDKVREGNTAQKKVIAQQVAEVFPQAVEKQITEIIPDIYQTATMNENGWIFGVETLKHNVCTGEKVQILFEDRKELLEVLEVKEDAFRVDVEPSNFNGATIFVYGRQVHDFHTVDYQAISMLNVSATQQLAKENEALKKRVTELETKLKIVTELEQQNAEMKAMLEQIQVQLNNQ